MRTCTKAAVAICGERKLTEKVPLKAASYVLAGHIEPTYHIPNQTSDKVVCSRKAARHSARHDNKYRHKIISIQDLGTSIMHRNCRSPPLSHYPLSIATRHLLDKLSTHVTAPAISTSIQYRMLAPIVKLRAKKNRIKTKGRFCFMELPTELRIKIYEFLLICDGDVEIPIDGLFRAERQPRVLNSVPLYSESQPAVAIMRTCRLVYQEAMPILWGKNNFAMCLADLSKPFFLSKMSWSAVEQLGSITFTSNTLSSSLMGESNVRPHFICSGKEIMDRFSALDLLYSPYGPDECMSLSVRNWVSTRVTRAELVAIQYALETMLNTPQMLLAAMGPAPQNVPAAVPASNANDAQDN